MTPELTALARAYMALPGAPEWDLNADGWDLSDGRFRQADTGVLWLRLGRGRCSPGEWLPDLTDRANGGALLTLLAPGWLAYQREHDGRWEVSRPDGEHRQEGATLAEAVARVAVAVGRAG